MKSDGESRKLRNLIAPPSHTLSGAWFWQSPRKRKKMFTCFRSPLLPLSVHKFLSHMMIIRLFFRVFFFAVVVCDLCQNVVGYNRACPYPIRMKIPAVDESGHHTHLTLPFDDCTEEAVTKTCATRFNEGECLIVESYVSNFINGLRDYHYSSRSSPMLDFMSLTTSNGIERYIPIYENCNATWGAVLDVAMQSAPMKGVLDIQSLAYEREDVLYSCERSRFCDRPPKRSEAWSRHLEFAKETYRQFSEDLRAANTGLQTSTSF